MPPFEKPQQRDNSEIGRDNKQENAINKELLRSQLFDWITNNKDTILDWANPEITSQSPEILQMKEDIRRFFHLPDGENITLKVLGDPTRLDRVHMSVNAIVEKTQRVLYIVPFTYDPNSEVLSASMKEADVAPTLEEYSAEDPYTLHRKCREALRLPEDMNGITYHKVFDSGSHFTHVTAIHDPTGISLGSASFDNQTWKLVSRKIDRDAIEGVARILKDDNDLDKLRSSGREEFMESMLQRNIHDLLGGTISPVDRAAMLRAIIAHMFPEYVEELRSEQLTLGLDSYDVNEVHLSVHDPQNRILGTLTFDLNRGVTTASSDDPRVLKDQ